MTNPILRGCLLIASATALILWTAPASFSLEVTKPVPAERREAMSLADAVIKALQNNLDIHIGRQTKESRLADIVIEQPAARGESTPSTSRTGTTGIVHTI